MTRRQVHWGLGVVVALLGGAGAFFVLWSHEPIGERVATVEPFPPLVVTIPEEEQQEVTEPVAPAEEVPASEQVEEPDPVPAEAAPPAQFDIAVPFTVQAPLADWSMPYQEACEEASLLMAASAYLPDLTSWQTAEEAQEALLHVLAIEEKLFGYPPDMTAEQTAALMRTLYPQLQVDVVLEPTPVFLKQELQQGRLFLVPAAGRLLGNPYFSGEGPLYHMLVLRGYTPEYVLTNDPGTRHGERFVYQWDTFMRAMGDWNDGSPETGQKAVVRVYPKE